jgi:serine/threonine protein kinase/CheY-like chemotaxis protein
MTLPAESPKPNAGQTLLVVDDNETNRDMLSRRLERSGFNVLVAADGQAALDIVGRKSVDLVLLDIMMPGMNGIDVLKVLRASHSAAELPVIMATAKTDTSDVVQALTLGANDYVTKPIDFPIVLARVQAHLRTRRILLTREGPVALPTPTPQGTAPGPYAPVGPGTIIAEKYRIESPIGSGNFGTVYRARHLDLDSGVAVKVLQATLADAEGLARFRREGISACRVRHPNAVAMLDFGVTPGGVAFLVMELLEGRSLLDELREHGTLSPSRCAEILIPVCDVLAESHRSAIIHRDVKPSNIFLQRTGRGEVPKVLDFGIAKMADVAVGQNLTMEGTVLGTPAYMAPERFRTRPYDGKSDVYSLGVMLYQMLAGRLPFTAEGVDPMALVWAHQSEAPPPLREVKPGLSAAVEAVVMQALRKDPEQRPTAEELARNLARAVGHGAEDVSLLSDEWGDTSEAVTRVAVATPTGPTLENPDRTTSPEAADDSPGDQNPID